ncbi:MAG: tetratricopeptide repeat protein [Myxococcales bacterium]
MHSGRGFQTRPAGSLGALIAGAALMLALAARAGADPVGPAEDKRSAARARLVDGDHLLKTGEFQQALAAFKDAYALFPSPKIHYNFALAYQGMGRNADALEALDTFLRDATDVRPEVRERRARRAPGCCNGWGCCA